MKQEDVAETFRAVREFSLERCPLAELQVGVQALAECWGYRDWTGQESDRHPQRAPQRRDEPGKLGKGQLEKRRMGRSAHPTLTRQVRHLHKSRGSLGKTKILKKIAVVMEVEGRMQVRQKDFGLEQ